MDVAQLKALWTGVLAESPPTLANYNRMAEQVVAAWKDGDAQIVQMIRQRHPRLRQLPDSELPNADFTLADAQLLIAQELQFQGWADLSEHVDALNDEKSLPSRFEAGVEAVITGDIARLERLLCEDPELIVARSQRKHHATLLHYVAANGVERQRSPSNSVEIAKLLLERGAEVDALAGTYGNDNYQTTMNLLVSSCHPARAGVQAGLVDTLLDFGAAINGLEDDCSPLITALAFHYPKAAETLAGRGARVDTIVAAAALGREDLVDSFVGESKKLKGGVPLVGVRWLSLPPEPQANLEQALVWAAMHHRTGVVERLLQKGVTPDARDNRKSTALHWAAYYGYVDTIELLLKWKAPLEVENKFGGTVLGQLTWSAIHEPADHHPLTIEMLLAAGAKVESADYPTGNQRIDEALRRYGAKQNTD